jgi:hypothetical protein
MRRVRFTAMMWSSPQFTLWFSERFRRFRRFSFNASRQIHSDDVVIAGVYLMV